MKTGLWESNTSVVLLGEAVECCTLDGESPVAESITSLRSDPSSMGHVESRVNQQGPPCKAKYSWVTDSEVKRGKAYGGYLGTQRRGRA